MDSNLFTSLGGGFRTQFAKQAEACFTYTTHIYVLLRFREPPTLMTVVLFAENFGLRGITSFIIACRITQ